VSACSGFHGKDVLFEQLGVEGVGGDRTDDDH
jgi:hypothetical protein